MYIIREFSEYKKCHNYFDYDSLFECVEFDKPLYSIINKRKTAKLIHISPKEYLNIISKNFNISYEVTISDTYINSENVDKYSEMMLSGSKAPIVYYKENSKLQEGRHRALAAMKLGCEEIPVIVFKELDNIEFNEIISEIKDFSEEELNIYFTKRGFSKGISKLCYNTLENYKNYVL